MYEEKAKIVLEQFQELINYKFNEARLLREAPTTKQRGKQLGIPHNDDIFKTLGDFVRNFS